MKKITFFFLFSFLFACNTSSINSAYKDYYKYQQKYISAILDNNTQQKIKALKGLVECGGFLHFDTKDYSQKLYKLLHKNMKSKIYLKKSKDKAPSNNAKLPPKHIKIYSYNPLKIKIPNTNIKYFTIKSKQYFKKVFDLPNSIIFKPISRKLTNNIQMKIAQYNKKTVRLVLYSKKIFLIKYSIKNSVLTIIYTSAAKKNIQTVLAQKPKIYKKAKIIVIDPGHGGKDVGGVGINNRYEKISVLKIAKYLKNDLIGKGYTVYLTRNSDYFIPLKKRTHFANLKKADLFISIHCNIAPGHNKRAHGIETYYLSPTRNERAIRVARLENKEIKGLNYTDQRVILNFLNRDRIIDSNKLAIDIQGGILKNLRKHYSYIKDGGVRPAPFWVLVGTQMPAILIETGYLTNPVEVKRLFNSNYQKKLAYGIADGIDSYFRKNR